MTKTLHKSIISFMFFVCVFAPSLVSAHQPRITESRLTSVSDPEISKAYYAELTGEPDVYTIQSDKPFDLYVGVLVPDIAGQKQDVSAAVLKDGKQIVVLDGASFVWKKFFEKFGHDTYLQGPEYRASVDSGIYEIRVWSSNNDSKYSLAIGEIEAFDGKEGLNAIKLIPQIKKDFFNESPVDFILSPFGWGTIVMLYIVAFIVGFAYRSILKKLASNSPRGISKNIGKPDRLLRLAIAILLLLWAITTSWSLWLIFFSGFALFEAIFSWCGFYAAIGKNTCPLE